MPVTNEPNISTMPGNGRNNQNRKSHSYITFRGGTNVDDIALQMNVCYTSCNPTDTDHRIHQQSTEEGSLYLYDDIIIVSQSTRQQRRQNSEVFPQSVALPVSCTNHGQNLKHFETASESSDNDSNPLQSPDYVISSITSVVLDNAKKNLMFNVHSHNSPLATPTYENVDPASGVPMTPHGQPIVRTKWTTGGTEQPERATLPLAGVQQRVSNRQSVAPVVEPAEYEEPVATLTRGRKLKKNVKVDQNCS